MSRIKERRAIQPLSSQPRKPESPVGRRTSIWIRPHDVRTILVELKLLAYYYLSPPRFPKWKGILRLGADLLGIIIVLMVISFIGLRTWITSSFIDAQSASLLPECVTIQDCNRVTATPGAKASQPVSQVIPVATLTPLSPPTPTPVPRTPRFSPTPTPSTAILAVVPSSLTVSYSHVCVIKAPVVLVLKNVGGTALLWWQDKNNTSPGIRIIDPTKSYLLQSGQSVTANVFCSPGNNDGHYKLLILYNAGEVTVPLTVTD
jgi:hypothetical protein